MNHIPLHLFAIKSHPNLISIPPKPSTDISNISAVSRRSVTPSLHHPSLITITHHSSPSPITHHHHPSHRHSVIPSSLFFTISFCHYRPLLFWISSAPIKFRASFSVMWLDDHHLTSLHSCGEQFLLLFLWSYDFILSNLVLLSSVPVYLCISVYNELLRFSKTPVCNRLKPIHFCFIFCHPHCLPSSLNLTDTWFHKEGHNT